MFCRQLSLASSDNVFELPSHFIDIAKHLFVGKADNRVAHSVQVGRAKLVSDGLFSLEMIFAVYLDYEFIMKVDEVGNVIANDLLPPELITNAIPLEHVPKRLFGVGHEEFVFLGKLLQQMIGSRFRRFVNKLIFALAPSGGGKGEASCITYVQELRYRAGPCRS